MRKLLFLLTTPIGRRRILRGILFRLGGLLGPIAALMRRTITRRARLVAVVGSYGKTTTTRAVMAVLGLDPSHHHGWNAGGFVAARVLSLTPSTPYGVVEAGISKPGTMERYARWVRPDLVVATSIGSEHHTSLGSLTTTRHEKAEMVRSLASSGLAVLNGDDENILWMRTQTTARVVTFGFESTNDVWASHLALDARGGTSFRLHCCDADENVRIRLTGRPMVYAALAAAAVGLAEGVPLGLIVQRLGELPPTPERLQPMQTPVGALLLVDTAKSFSETIEVGLEALDDIPARRRLVVIGDVEEPQGKQGPLYKALGRRLARSADQIIYVGGRKPFASVASGAVGSGFPRDRLIYAGRDVLDAADILRKELAGGDVVWIKGRSTQHLGRIALAVAGKEVRCRLLSCPFTPGCGSCVMLERRA